MLTTEVREAVRFALAAVLEEEVTALLGALPFERSPLRSDQRDGHYRRDLGTSVGLIEGLAVPRTRRGLKTQLFERYARRTQETDSAMGEMFIACLHFYSFPPSHWKAIRTTNAIERLIEEVKKRSHKMSAPFRNEGSCLLMFYAVIRGVKFQRLTMPLRTDRQDSPAPILQKGCVPVGEVYVRLVARRPLTC